MRQTYRAARVLQAADDDSGRHSLVREDGQARTPAAADFWSTSQLASQEATLATSGEMATSRHRDIAILPAAKMCARRLRHPASLAALGTRSEQRVPLVPLSYARKAAMSRRTKWRSPLTASSLRAFGLEGRPGAPSAPAMKRG